MQNIAIQKLARKAYTTYLFKVNRSILSYSLDQRNYMKLFSLLFTRTFFWCLSLLLLIVLIFFQTKKNTFFFQFNSQSFTLFPFLSLV